MAISGHSIEPAASTEFTAASVTAKVKALTSEALQVRRRLAVLDETYHTDDDVNKNDTIENTEL